jgi:hypothetical protein
MCTCPELSATDLSKIEITEESTSRLEIAEANYVSKPVKGATYR